MEHLEKIKKNNVESSKANQLRSINENIAANQARQTWLQEDYWKRTEKEKGFDLLAEANAFSVKLSEIEVQLKEVDIEISLHQILEVYKSWDF